MGNYEESLWESSTNSHGRHTHKCMHEYMIKLFHYQLDLNSLTYLKLYSFINIGIAVL